ncbi:MFS general substrate transporter [Guyanagaster necrorhizus]|uniref:MFS general substrate transporter n=1 Tax=Guyanagaster necrorhizus TaxID=856835 RepID=A0A9P7VRR4_9AGAR|nr:MFS general substrate transporter [Guyanagaster necrorhizus MCA 3950]KAG7445510.1 MFS general substrate transporter [Guyanagaster necrorhizus MCA 3950]
MAKDEESTLSPHLDLPNAKEGSISPQQNPRDYEPTDGGFKAWSTVLGASLVGLCTFGFVNAYGAFSDYYNETYLSDYSPTLISMIGALQVFLLYIFAGFAGAVFDALGPRLLVPGSGIVVAFSIFMLSITKPQKIWQQYLCQGVLFNVGATFGYFPCLAITAHWFRRKNAYATGCVAAGVSVGGIIIPIMMHRLLPKIGFGWTIRIIGFICLFCYTVAMITIYPRRPTKPLPPMSRLLDFGAFKHPTYSLLAIGGWISIFSTFNPFVYVGLYGSVAFGESKLTSYYLAILCAASIVGRVGHGLIADRLGRYNLICAATLLSSILILALWYTSSTEGGLVAFAVLYGFASGPFFSLFPACVAQISPIERVGARMGMMFTFMSIGALSGTPIGGVFIQTKTIENFHRLILFSGIVGLGGSMVLFLARFSLQRKIFVIV